MVPVSKLAIKRSLSSLALAVPLLDRCHSSAMCQLLKPGPDLEISNTPVTHWAALRDCYSHNSASATLRFPSENLGDVDCGAEEDENPGYACNIWLSQRLLSQHTAGLLKHVQEEKLSNNFGRTSWSFKIHLVIALHDEKRDHLNKDMESFKNEKTAISLIEKRRNKIFLMERIHSNGWINFGEPAFNDSKAR